MMIPPSGKTMLRFGAASLLLAMTPLYSQQTANPSLFPADSDSDGLSDALEQRLLDQFAPKFMVGEHDCSIGPAEFEPEVQRPSVLADNGTIYGQVFPFKDATDRGTIAEIHYYHLWRKDCGGHGHPLDAEHVAVLVRASNPDLETASWTGVYWYAAAHENTVCDVSQIARAATLDAEDHGATVWISPGKHASYLNGSLCQRGCGADRCENMVPLQPTALINLGEPQHPMNGALFYPSKEWPLMAKMSTTDFPAAAVARLNQIPDADIAWFNPGRHPAQGVIAESSITGQAIAGSGRNTTTAIALAANSTEDALSAANGSTGEAISTAGNSTGNALQKTCAHTLHDLGTVARHVGDALHITSTKTAEAPR
ncbi:MAG TPA: hypothetical protein VGG62_11000 [Terracidiphilus sp.]